MVQMNVAGTQYVFVPTVAGTSGLATPNWPTTVGGTVNDGSVVWENAGLKTSLACFGDVIDYVKQGNSQWWQSLLNGLLP
jgi:hypothetical protein